VGVKGNVNATAAVAVAAQVGANFDNIKTALNTALTGITQSTGGLAGALLILFTSLSQGQVSSLIQAVNQTQTIVNNIKVAATLTATDLTPGKQFNSSCICKTGKSDIET